MDFVTETSFNRLRSQCCLTGNLHYVNIVSNAIRERTGSLVVTAMVATALLLPIGGGAASASGDPVTAARAELAGATEARMASEARVGEVEREIEALEAQVAEMDATDEHLTRELAEAKDTVRQFAVTAYIEGHNADMASAVLDPTDSQQLMWKSTITVGHAATVQEAADQYAELMAAAGPKRAALAQTLEAAQAALVDAKNDAIQAAAFERDAEARLAKAKDDQRRAAEEAARRRATEAARSQSFAVASGQNSASAASSASTQGATSSGSGAMGNPTAAELATLAKIRRCESRGNYGIVSASGRYRGAYQFDYRTWAGMGGSGDPAAASPAEQDYRALMLLRARGTRPWPNCGR